MKLSKMGVSGVALDWFKSYLSDRYQCVDINGNLSESKRIKISILQGSILGPILFLCFINDLYLVPTLFTLMSLNICQTAFHRTHFTAPFLVKLRYHNSELSITNV
jgi:hypothetical protein